MIFGRKTEGDNILKHSCGGTILQGLQNVIAKCLLLQ